MGEWVGPHGPDELGAGSNPSVYLNTFAVFLKIWNLRDVSFLLLSRLLISAGF